MDFANYWFSSAAGGGGYEIGNSLRFRGNQYLSWADNVTGSPSGRLLWTLSMWVKRARNGTTEDPFSAYQNNNNRFRFTLGSDDKLSSEEVGAGGSKLEAISAGQYRDPSAWYHYVIVYDTNNGDSNDRLRLYVNGVEDSPVNPSTASGWAGVIGDNGTELNFGSKLLSSRSAYFVGYLAEIHMVSEQGLDPTEFAEYDANGVWSPKVFSGSYGAHGFYLDFSDPSNIGADRSGNGNNWTATNFELTNTTSTSYDWVEDTPTTNWCTLNPLDKNSGQLPKDGNLYFDGSVSTGGLDVIAGTIRVSSGKYYWESTITAVGSIAVAAVGITKIQSVGRSVSGGLGGVSGECAYLPSGNKEVDGSSTSYGSSFTTGDVIGVALDCDAGTVTFYKNNTSQGAITYAVGGGLAPAIGQVQGYGAIQTVNFGQRDFAYTPPTGFNALNTANLPAPDIANGSANFRAVTYTGTGGTRDLVIENKAGVAWQPDFAWLKNRDVVDHHALFDSVRGALNWIASNSDAAESSLANSLTSFNADGYTLGSANLTNFLNQGYISWNWLAGNGTETNTDGTLSNTVTVSANPAAGFSIVEYTGDGVSNATVGHGLSAVPAFVMHKALSGSTAPWYCKHKNIASGTNLYLNWDYGETALTSSGGIGDLTSSTTFTCANGSSNNANVNTSGRRYVAYCFAEVEGYSKFGSYTGNGSTDGPFVYTGHAVAFVMIKRTDAASEWAMYDNERPGYNPDSQLRANTGDIDNSNPVVFIDTISNGFKIRTGDPAQNASGSSYIYISFAENPFGGSGVSPATAR